MGSFLVGWVLTLVPASLGQVDRNHTELLNARLNPLQVPFLWPGELPVHFPRFKHCEMTWVSLIVGMWACGPSPGKGLVPCPPKALHREGIVIQRSKGERCALPMLTCLASQHFGEPRGGVR